MHQQIKTDILYAYIYIRVLYRLDEGKREIKERDMVMVVDTERRACTYSMTTY